MYLCDIPDISFKIDNFNRTNMLKLEKEWDGTEGQVHYPNETIQEKIGGTRNLSLCPWKF
jgi:hypothetical protein